MAPRYLPVATFQQWWQDETSQNATLIEAAILAAERAIDNELGRPMIVATTASARSYAPDAASDLLWIDDCTTITSITEDGTAVSSDDWQAEPLNNLTSAGETVPYYKVRRLDGDWYSNRRKATVTVTATWGWAAIPYEVVEACKTLAKDILLNRDARFGLAGITDAGGVGMRENPVVRSMLSHYRRAAVFAA